jgi:hypothetical protein
MALSISSEMDADPNHSGFAEGFGYERFQVFRDGTSIVDAADTDGATFAVPAASHSYRIVDTIDRAALGFTAATTTSAVYTVRSSSTSGQALPGGWQCVAPGTGACTVLPLLTIDAPLPITAAGTMLTGASSFVVSVGHVPAGAQPAISKLTFATSLDGKTFTPAKVTSLGHGQYKVTLITPVSAAGQQVSTQVHAADAAGGTLIQTVTNAYTVAGS